LILTYILIIYRNYIVPNLVEYILKISSRLVHYCSKDASKNERKHFSLENLQQYRKIKDSMSHSIFEADVEKKLCQKNKL